MTIMVGNTGSASLVCMPIQLRTELNLTCLIYCKQEATASRSTGKSSTYWIQHSARFHIVNYWTKTAFVNMNLLCKFRYTSISKIKNGQRFMSYLAQQQFSNKEEHQVGRVRGVGWGDPVLLLLSHKVTIICAQMYCVIQQCRAVYNPKDQRY